LPVNDLAAEQAHLYLWAPSAYLFDAKAVLEAWSFTYRSTFVWVNPQPGEGPYWRESHTVLLLGVRGVAPFREAMRSWVEVPAEPGGGKPGIIREMIERVSPAPYLELFNPQAVPGWAVWHPETGYTLDHEQASVPLQPISFVSSLRLKTLMPSAWVEAARPRPATTDTLGPPSSSDFHLPPEMSFAKAVIAGGVAYIFRHCDLGLLGRGVALVWHTPHEYAEMPHTA